MLEDSQKEAESIVSQARAHADRIREESDRELVAATQRRDSINAQLTNVRQMLATLTSAAPAALFADQADQADQAAFGASDASDEAAGAANLETDVAVDDAELGVDDGGLPLDVDDSDEADVADAPEAADDADDADDADAEEDEAVAEDQGAAKA
jgi:hypothetical protein